MKLRIDSCPRCLTKTVAYDFAFPSRGGLAMFFRCPTCGRGWFTTYILEDDVSSRPQWLQHTTAEGHDSQKWPWEAPRRPQRRVRAAAGENLSAQNDVDKGYNNT